ncbi:MAG TPA: VIT domain-containing protein, partial [Candidatus Fermentibacter daniensis]|nr:VIT domain-containing protein [Candidatus Fermentibacter daniensis]
MSKKNRKNPKESGYGMVSSGGEPVPLKGVSIDVRIRGAAVLTTVSQRFRNDEQSPIEALYSFPLEENGSVCGFEVEIGARRIKGRVEEREKAFEIYDEAMKKGDSAFLLDQNRPDIFSVSVGRLLPGEEAV